ncbi:MAG: hypothetical protein QOI80_3153 [Solirubrobacteraceae bacterium]|nr:hypothetical protein [Solirubrobacteraceae bacterium]
MGVRILVASLGAVLLAVACSASASARPGWSPVSVISGFRPLPTDPVIALSPRGDGLVAAVTPRFGAPGALKVSARPPGGKFAAPTVLSTPGSSAGGFAVALDRSGGAVAVWDESDSTSVEQSVRLATRPSGGAFSAPVGVGTGQNSRVGMTAAGEAVIAWETTDADGVAGDVTAVVAPGAPAPGPATTVRDATGFPVIDSALAVGADGTAILAFRGSDGTIQASIRPPAGAFGAPIVLSDPQVTVGPPAVAVDGHGGAMVVWSRQVFVSPERGYEPVAIQAATGAAGAQLATRGDVAPVDGPASDPAAASDDAGRLTVAWRERAGVRTVTLPQGGAFGPPVTVARDPATPDLLKVPVALATAPDGTTTIGLDGDRTPQPGVVLATVRPAAAASFGSVCTLASNAGGATVAAGSAGAIAAAWAQVTGSAEDVASSSYVATGSTHCAPAPLISSLTVRPASFRASRRGPSTGRRGGRVKLVINRAGKVTWTVQRLTATAGRWATVPGTFRRSAKAGRNSFHFTGRIGGRTLSPNYYRLAAVPRAGGVRGETATVEFSIRRR